MTRTVVYKGHQIKVHAVVVTDSEEDEWAAQAVVRIPVPEGHREQPLGDPDDRTFASQEDAEGYALQLAMRWVDRHRP
jgi:hypothetical protein